MNDYIVCPRCENLFSTISSLGQWECRYHPGSQVMEEKNGKERYKWTCCQKYERVIHYNTVATLSSSEEYIPNRISGCTACDHGTDHDPVSLQSIQEYLLHMNTDTLRGLNRNKQIIYRTKVDHERSLNEVHEL